MTQGKDTHRYTVPALQRGLELLGEFSRESKPLTGAELARRLKLPRASVFRILQTLELMGFVQRVGDSSQYQLGLAVLRLGFGLLASLEITHLAQPILLGLSERTGLSSHLVVRDETQVVIVAKVLGAQSLFNSLQVGARLPAHATVIGRVLMSDLSWEALGALYGQTPLTPYTELTPTTLERLYELTSQVRAQGFGISQGGFEMGISTIAATVRDQSAQVVAAVSITVPSQKIDPTSLDTLVADIQGAALELSALLGYRPLERSALTQASSALCAA